MALTSISKDFVTRAGVIVEGTGTVTSSTGQTNALQVNSGAAIKSNLIVGSTATIYGPTILFGNLTANSPASINNTLNVTGQTTLGPTTATIFSATSVIVSGNINSNLLNVTGQTTLGPTTATIFSATSISVTGDETIGGSLTVLGQTVFDAFTATNSTVTNLTVLASLISVGQTTLGPTTATVFSATSISVTGDGSIAGTFAITNNTNATGASNGSGALQVTGGVGIARDLWVGGTSYLQGDLYVDGTQFIVNNQTISTGDKTLTLSTASTTSTLAAGSGILIGNTSSAAAYAYWLYDGFSNPGYWYTANGIKINANSDANSASSGALQVTGGVGVGGGIYVTSVVTASNFVGYLGSANSAIGSGANLYGGDRGQLVYQTAPNTTGFLSTGSNGQLLYMSGGVPIWQNASGLSAGNATTSSNLAGGLKDQIPYQSNPGQTTFNAGLVYNGTTFTTTNIQVTSNNNATAATGNSGALMVTGGVGISRDLWVGGDINVNGSIYLKGVGLDTITGTTGTFVNVNVTGTGYALTVPNGSVNIGNNLTATTVTIISGNANTATLTSNALYVAGGVGIAKTLAVTGDTWIAGNLNVQGNITGTNVVINNLTGTNAQFYGDSTGNGALYAGVLGYTPFAQTMFQATGNLNNYMEINVQNINSGAKASTDIVASADNVTTSSAYIDMGITSSAWDGSQLYSLGTTLGPNDGYIMVGQNASTADHRGDLVLGTTTDGTQIKFVIAATATQVTTASIAIVMSQVNTVALSTVTGTLAVYGGIAATSAYIGGTVTSTAQVIYGITSASSTNSGALQVAGGAGIGGGLYVGGAITGTSLTVQSAQITNTTAAVSSTTGALQVLGGVGISGGLVVGGIITATNQLVVNAQASFNNAQTQFNNGLYSNGPFVVYSPLAQFNAPVSVVNTSPASSTNTGALQVVGGVGIGGGLYVGGVVTASNFVGNLTGTASNATNADSASTATNIAGGSAGSIPIQASSGITGFIPLGTSGYILTAGTNTATWTSVNGLSAGNATTATNIGGFSAQQVLFQFKSGITTATSGLTFNLNNNQLTASNLIVSGITTSSGQLVANSGAASLGTNTGALVVSGGAGIAGAINAGGIVYAGLQGAATNAPVLTFSGGNTTFATYTSNSLTGSGTVTLDSWSTSTYRTARYVIQIVDSGKVHITEMTVFTDWVNVYMNQYGISTNQGELGTFDADSTSTVGSVTLTFSPSPAATAMVIKMSRLGISA